ncbi:MAG: hypothetical protein CVU61_09985 [Deltaproteobacteria bacterium HGW-Deltaproteobacteria-19]|nr:MAG: hypothetical protein CVU61_09985 [Deltaproteobacteria bacterium HGW-Deltaproteobacteria-19]
MNGVISDITVKGFFKQSMVLFAAIVCLLTPAPAVYAQPALLDAGMSPDRAVWAFDRDVHDAAKDVRFWMRVQRQGNLNQYGTFDYYFRVRVFRPDSSEVWNTQYGFNEQGYSEQTFTFPNFFYDRSPDRRSPSFGTWRVRTAVVEKDTKREVSVKEYSLQFIDGKKPAPPPTAGPAVGSGKPFPVPRFQYGKWVLKDWGIGIYDEVVTGNNTYDREIKELNSRDTFSVKEVMNAWSKGHKFGALLAGPPVKTYINSNNMPLYLFGYILKRPGGEIDGRNPQHRVSQYCNNPGSLIFPFDLRKPGRYRLEFLLRERDRPSWEESSWVPIGGIDFTLTE